MKRFINKILGILALVALLSACKKEAVLTVLGDLVFPSPSFKA